MSIDTGKLRLRRPGAREIGNLGKHPSCTRLALMTTHCINPSVASRQVFGVDSPEGQSPFAISKGNLFDKRMSENGGQRLLELYQEEGRLQASETNCVNLGELFPKPSPEMLDMREHHTREYLKKKARGDDAPHLIIKPRVGLTVAHQRFVIEPDFLVASERDVFYRIGEIKSYADRGGQTDTSKLKSACMQCAVGFVALREQMRADGFTAEMVPRMDLVLVMPNSMTPRLKEQAIIGEVAAIQEVLEQLPSTLQAAYQLIPGGAKLDEPEVLESIPNHYATRCREFCGMANACRRQACQSGQIALLGDGAQQSLMPCEDLNQLIAFMEGTEQPTSEQERALAAQLHLASGLYEEAFRS